MKLSSCKTKVLSAVLTLLLSVSEAGHSSSCKIWQSDIQKSENTVKVSRNYRGLWLSHKCEIHPGPRFVLRRYHILRNGHFNLVRFYYIDPWCTVVSFSVTAVGSFSPAPEKATSSSISWVVPGGLELDFTLRKVVLVPFTLESALDLSMKVNASCPSIVSNPWRPFKKYKILSHDMQRNQKRNLDTGSMNEMDCTAPLELNFDELLLMRLEHRAPLHFLAYKKIDRASKETTQWYSSHLYFGAEGIQRRSRPTYYQQSLLPSQTVQCPVCHSLAKSSMISPPKLIMSYDSRPPDTGLEGQWISLRCEVRPYGLFLHRAFIFDGRGEKWQAQHSYFKDPQCHHPMFTLRANGSYYPGPQSKTIADASEYDFHITESSLTPDDKQFANNLNGLLTCGPGSHWKVGQVGNLTSSGGCKELGIIVPSVEQDLVRFEKVNPDVLYLYLGESTDGRTRPTSFQPPLIRCSSPFAKSSDDYFLNYNELHPLPLISGALNVHICYYEILCICIIYLVGSSFCSKF